MIKYSSLIARICHSPGMPVCSEEENIAEVDFNFCQPNVKLSEIYRIYITRIDAPDFEDINEAGEWMVRISQDSMNAYAMRMLTVIGDKPLPASQKAKISANRTRTIRKDHTINATIDEVSDANHNFISKLKANGSYFKFWYETWGGLMFGGTKGIIGKFFGDMVLLRGTGEIMTFEVVINWQALRTEDFFTSPIFNQGVFDMVVIATDDDQPIVIDDGNLIHTD